MRGRLNNANQELDGVRKEQKQGEWQIKDVTDTLTSISRKLYGGEVTNPREIENMRYRLDTLETAKNRLEENVIELMERAEALESKIARLDSEITQKEAQLAGLEDERDSEVASISGKLSDIKQTGKTAGSNTGARRYPATEGRSGPVVVPIRGRICGGCHVELPSSIVILAKPNNSLVRCENCGRILCWLE